MTLRFQTLLTLRVTHAYCDGPCREVRWALQRGEKVKVSGFPRPRRLRFSAAYRPNSISRVFSRLRLSANFSSLARIASRNRPESVSRSKPTMR